MFSGTISGAIAQKFMKKNEHFNTMNQNNQLRGHFYLCLLSKIALKCTLAFFAVMIFTGSFTFFDL